MKITSKRGKKPEVKDDSAYQDAYDLIIIESGAVSPEQIRRAEEVFREIRKQLEDTGRILDVE